MSKCICSEMELCDGCPWCLSGEFCDKVLEDFTRFLSNWMDGIHHAIEAGVSEKQ